MALTATYDGVLSRIRLAMTGAGGTATYCVFDRTIDGGITYTTVRGGSVVTIASTNANVDDYEWNPGVATTYRARTYTAANALVNTFTAAITQDLTSVWLKVPAAPYLNMPVTVVDRGDITRRSRSTLFDVVGRTLPVMVGDIASSIAYELQVLTQTAGDESNLDFLFASGEVVYLQLPSSVDDFPGGYFSVSDVKRAPTMRLSSRRVWSIPLTQIAAPGPDVIGPVYTWTNVLADYATWTALTGANASWSALLAHTGTPSDVIVA